MTGHNGCMTVETVSIGTELLLGQTVDTNVAYLARVLAEAGCDHYYRQTVGDNLGRVTEALRLALSRSDIVVTIGGLGPTEDDMTRDALAQVVGEENEFDPTIYASIEERFARSGREIGPTQRRQAFRPPHATILKNPNGTAVGLCVPIGDRTVYCLPGPPNEFKPMVDGPFRRELERQFSGTPLLQRVLRVHGIGEGALEEALADLLHLPDVTVAPYAKTGEVHVRLAIRAGEGAEEALDDAARSVRERLSHADVYGEGEGSIQAIVVGELLEKGVTLVAAESCTAGLFSALMTEADGSSKCFLGGCVTYSPESKIDLVGVYESTLARTGTVSAETAGEMAEGIRQRLKGDIGVSITGVAGADELIEPPMPKPSGMVYIGIATESGTDVTRHQFLGNRETIRLRAVSEAFHQVRLALKRAPTDR